MHVSFNLNAPHPVTKNWQQRRYEHLCDLLLLSFMAVELLALFCSPVSISFNTSPVELTGWMLASGTASPFGCELVKIPSVCKSRKNKYFDV